MSLRVFSIVGLSFVLLSGCSAAPEGPEIPEGVQSSEQAAKPVSSCAAILCMVGYVCVEKGHHARCVKADVTDPCATVRCAAGYQCVSSGGIASCDPILCEEGACGPALGMPLTLCPDGVNYSGPTGNCLSSSSGCAWEILTCP